MKSKQRPTRFSGIEVHVLLFPRIITMATVGTLVHTVAKVVVVIGAVAIFQLAAMNTCIFTGVVAATADGPAYRFGARVVAMTSCCSCSCSFTSSLHCSVAAPFLSYSFALFCDE